MKILSKPDISGWNLKRTCEQCDAELEIEGSDIKFFSDQRDGDSWSIHCPICNNVIYISEQEIPKLVRLSIRNKSYSRLDQW
jgi:hypothetical protein